MSDSNQKIKEIYSERVRKYGYSPEGLGWGKKDRRNLRFQMLTGQWDLEGATVLDVGCGFGDLFGYLNNTGVALKGYVGVDVNGDILDVARQIHPEATFVCESVQNIEEKFDYVFASGLFNDYRDDAHDFVDSMLIEFNRRCVKGFAANFLSSKVDQRYQDCHYNDPAEILRKGYNFSNNVVLRNDYMPYEFTLLVNKYSGFSPETAVYDEYVRYLGLDLDE